VPRLCEVYPGICITTEEKSWKNLSQGKCLNANLHVTFRDLLHDVKLRHGTDGFTSPPKEGVLGIFSP
jgi:hypothetical protein